ncbi:hypothetical protein [Sphingomonas sp. TDK1]|uniref:hypothetical protein n=1 Tax=Sphingomonas sp. TDK1 TaxID=453247 RepID=UPI0007D92EA7|nr:hypothetical protein [Sphingomonas sp. TDK1]OAN57616.1 hypothetical protein A7X12_07085 [Sphingomonas sp. TDK1]
MKISHIGVALLAALLPSLSVAAIRQDAARADDEVDLAKIDVKDAIECRLDAPVYNRFAMAVTGEEQLAAKRGWKAVKSANFMMHEYALPAPITVAGEYTTQRVAFTSSGVLAILDLPDPAVLARKEHIENAMPSDGLVDALVASGKATREQAEAEIKFRKFLGERVIRDVTDPANGDKWRGHTVIARNISNVASHPGKTLYGCSYKIELLDKDGNAL